MSRAVFLPTPADPFLIDLWFKYYQIWKSEIDTLYVYANTPDLEAAEYVHKLCRDNGAVFFYSDHQIEHGEVLKRLLNHSKEEHIMFVEDDGFIFSKGTVAKYFEMLERNEYDLIGSPRGSCSQEILDKAKAKWELDYSGLGDNGCNFWPNFFFCKREYLQKVDNFGARHWNTGDVIKGLGNAEAECVGDTLVEASIQLRGLITKEKILEVPQYHGNTDDQIDWESATNIWDGNCPWLHVGSLSSGYLNLLDPDKQLPDAFNTEQERLELERRIVFWGMAVDEFTSNDLKDTRQSYSVMLQALVIQYNLSESRITRRREMYRKVMNRWLQT